ncbi:pyrroloquinoline quinone biosynthesis protein PqqE [Kutzneria albida]|uniref:PqqA peptide cyclase n=1 Tax=Kutzneria albida DSM 43870 TaxID=1449976 RepID=W5W7L6_9PSEU|nr:pyrroloquinoline quinone biosynthesis protein PqqE [Kutzneria albida]AHH94204.1 Coenzyme PQQ synthesis protein E [Kutzneria albida DSM 43870]
MTEPPLGLLAELTHRCPLHCPYCANPLDLVRRENELDTPTWRHILDQARDLGVLQVHLSGGEPLARPDLPEILGHAHHLGCYTNLVTSGLGLTPHRLADLIDRGLDHVQLSIQDADPATATRIAGTKAVEHKRRAADLITTAGLPLTINVVLHRANLDHLPAIIDLAEQLGADRLELANTQYYGWALRNRAALLPTPAQLAAAAPVVAAAQARSRMDIVYVLADYHQATPKPCMHGWAARQLTVTPNGDVLPCPAATALTDLPVENATHTPLAQIWYQSRSFTAYRGTDWMRDPCRSCPRNTIDHGGCRCQAFQLTGDATNTDPVCTLSPHHHLIQTILTEEITPQRPEFVMRQVTT